MSMRNVFRAVVFLLAVCMISALTGCGGGGSDGNGGNNPGSASNSKQLTAFGFANPASTGTIDETAKTVTVIVPFGTDVTSLVAVFTASGVETTVNSVEQESGVTTNDFTDPVIYTVTAANSSTRQYTVTVTVPVEVSKVFDFMTDGDALVKNAGSDWFFSDGGNTGNYSNGYGYYMNQTRIAAPWFFTGDFTVDIEFYLKVIDDDGIFRYGFSLVDRNWESTSTRKYFDFAAYYTDFPAHEDRYYQTGQGHGSVSSYDDEDASVPGIQSGVNTFRMVKSGSNISVYMNGTFVKTVVISPENLPADGYSPSIQGHNSWDQADSNFYLRSVTIRYMDGEVGYMDWNE